MNDQKEHPHAPGWKMLEVLDAGRKAKRVLRQRGQLMVVYDFERPGSVLDYVIGPLLEGEQSMFAALEETKAKKAAPLEPTEWSLGILGSLALPTSADVCAAMADSCRAAYALQRFLWLEAAREYNPTKHPGDWIDVHLLLYLADPTFVLVTREKQMPARIAGCGQEDRVLPFDDLWSQSQS